MLVLLAVVFFPVGVLILGPCAARGKFSMSRIERVSMIVSGFMGVSFY